MSKWQTFPSPPEALVVLRVLATQKLAEAHQEYGWM